MLVLKTVPLWYGTIFWMRITDSTFVVRIDLVRYRNNEYWRINPIQNDKTNVKNSLSLQGRAAEWYGTLNKDRLVLGSILPRGEKFPRPSWPPSALVKIEFYGSMVRIIAHF